MKQIYTLLTFLIYSLTFGQVINPASITTTFTAAEASGTHIDACFNGSGLSKTLKYEIYDTVGKKIKRGFVSENSSINIEDFSQGKSFLKLEEVNKLGL